MKATRLGRVTGRRILRSSIDDEVQRLNVRKRAEHVQVGEKIVMDPGGVVTVLKNLETADGFCRLLILRPNGGQALWKVHPWQSVEVFTERML